MIFYTSDKQKQIAEETVADIDASGLWPGKVVTGVTPAREFFGRRSANTRTILSGILPAIPAIS
jgi:peptide methionine sulfoxide reductase MsrA